MGKKSEAVLTEIMEAIGSIRIAVKEMRAEISEISTWNKNVHEQINTHMPRLDHHFKNIMVEVQALTEQRKRKRR